MAKIPYKNPNPKKEIFFFKNTFEEGEFKSKLVYVLFTELMSREAFENMFEYASQITEEESDKLVLEHDYEVVFVGDAHIIDTYFKEFDKEIKPN